MSLLGRKLYRELVAQKGQSLAIACVTAVGVMMFVVSAAAYQDLRDSYADTRARLGLATLLVEVPRLAPAQLLAARALPGVLEAEPRVRVELPAAAGRDHPALRVLSLPDSGEPRLDRVLVLEGQLPADGQLLVEKHFARFHHLTPGTHLTVAGAELEVSGVAVSPEYLWVSRDENDFMPSASDFGVAWLRRSALRALAARAAASGVASDAVAVAASDATGNELLVQAKPAAPASALARQLEKALGGGPEIRATPADALVAVRLMQMDLDGYKGMAAFFPFFFLGIAAFIVGSALARQVDAQRATVGTLLALGVGQGRVLAHFLAYAAALGGGGGAAGALLGQACAPLLTRAYADELSIPFVAVRLHPGLLAAGAGLGVLVAVLAGALPAVRAMRLQPADAMRPPRPHLGALASLARRLRAPLPLRLALREVLGRPLRSLGTALGIASALVLVLATGALVDSMKTTFRTLFDAARRYDVRVDFAAPVPADEALRAARGVVGVDAAEGLLALPVSLEANGARVGALLQALPPNARLLRSLDADGTAVQPRAGELALTRSLASKLKLSPRDRVVVTLPVRGPVTLTFCGAADAVLGPTGSASLADVEGALGASGMLTSVLVATPPARSGEVRDALARAFPGAAHVEDAAATRAQFDLLMGLGWVMVGVMLAFAGVLAAAVLFNTATLTVLERQRDLATLRALGRTMREVTALVTLQHALLGALGVALGVPLSIIAAKAMLRAFESELFSLPYVLDGSTVAGAVAGVLGLVLLAQWPALRQVGRASLADAVRVRE